MSHWGTARGWDIDPDLLLHHEPGPVEVVEGDPDPKKTKMHFQLYLTFCSGLDSQSDPHEALKSVCASEVRPGGTAAGEAEPDDLNRWGSPTEGVPRGETLLEEAWPRAPRAVTSEGEVGLRCGEGRGGGR